MATVTERYVQRPHEEISGRSTGSSVLPREFLEWQRRSRIALFRTLISVGSREVKTMPAHLAVLGSHGPTGEINLAMKGIGMLPVPHRLQAFTSLFRRTIDRCLEADWESTAGERMETLLSFYLNIGNFDESRLGGLEIFEGSTYSNLREDPRASLLFTGEPPTFNSYQVDGVVEFVKAPNPYYDFLLAAREMFARDFFHVSQSVYPYGFVVHVTGVKDKRPFSRV